MTLSKLFNVFYVRMLGRLLVLCFVRPARFLLSNNLCFTMFLSKYNDDDDDDDDELTTYSSRKQPL